MRFLAMVKVGRGSNGVRFRRLEGRGLANETEKLKVTKKTNLAVRTSRVRARTVRPELTLA